MLWEGISSKGLALAKKEDPYFHSIGELATKEYILAVELQRYSFRFTLEQDQDHFPRK